MRDLVIVCAHWTCCRRSETGSDWLAILDEAGRRHSRINGRRSVHVHPMQAISSSMPSMAREKSVSFFCSLKCRNRIFKQNEKPPKFLLFFFFPSHLEFYSFKMLRKKSTRYRPHRPYLSYDIIIFHKTINCQFYWIPLTIVPTIIVRWRKVSASQTSKIIHWTMNGTGSWMTRVSHHSNRVRRVRVVWHRYRSMIQLIQCTKQTINCVACTRQWMVPV